MKSIKPASKIPTVFILLGIILFSVILMVVFSFGMNYQRGLVSEKKQLGPVPTSPTDTSNSIYSTTFPTTKTVSPVPPTHVPSAANTVNYPIPKSWVRTRMSNGLTLCFPPKWEADQWGNVYFNRDSAYRPTVTYIQEIPYQGGSRREAFYQFWEKEYPTVRQTASVEEVVVNANTVLKFSGPENEKIVWFANGKLWQAGISGWAAVNDSKTLFLKNFYTMISCSFTN